ncbi:hypothetical protein [Sorangium sp. So ce1099]|uniref:hypothetical protein n=1 Tax=Sorangium sp. So ce1099 TaxID=3133331 RepID=UPI003F5E4EDF
MEDADVDDAEPLTVEDADVDEVESPPPDPESPTEPSHAISIIAGSARCRKPRVHRGPTNNPAFTS